MYFLRALRPSFMPFEIVLVLIVFKRKRRVDLLLFIDLLSFRNFNFDDVWSREGQTFSLRDRTTCAVRLDHIDSCWYFIRDFMLDLTFDFDKLKLGETRKFTFVSNDSNSWMTPSSLINVMSCIGWSSMKLYSLSSSFNSWLFNLDDRWMSGEPLRYFRKDLRLFNIRWIWLLWTQQRWVSFELKL